MSEYPEENVESDTESPSFSVSPDTLRECARGTNEVSISIVPSSASLVPGIPDFRVSLGMNTCSSNNGTEPELKAIPPPDSLCLPEVTDQFARSLHEVLGDITVPSPPPDVQDPTDEEKPDSTNKTLPSISFEEDE